MKMRKGYNHRSCALAALVLVALLAGCLRNDFDNIDANDREVKLWGGVRRTPGVSYASAPQQTRGTATSTSGILDPAWDGELEIAMVRVSKVENADLFPEFRLLDAPMPATLGRPDEQNSYYREIEFKTQAQFFPDTDSELRYVGWYPWEDSDLSTPNVDDNGSTFVSDADKTQVTVGITGSRDVLYGNVIEGTFEKGFPPMEFDHALCLYRIYAYSMVGSAEIDGDASLTTDEWGKIQEMTLNYMPTEVTMTLPHVCAEPGTPHNDVNHFSLSFSGEQNIALHDESNDIYFSAPESLPVGLADAVLVSKCIAAPPQKGVLSIGVKTEHHESLQEVSIARNFKPGHAYDIVLRFSDHGFINADVSVGKWQTHEEDVKLDMPAQLYYDLSVYETSNCYVISSGNYTYCFDGNVKGNGDGHLLGLTDEQIHFNPGWVDIIWEDLPTFDHDGDPSTPEIEPLEMQYNTLYENKIFVEVPGYVTYDAEGNEVLTDKELAVEGNALIGAYDKDPKEGGKLLWTWHLWLTDKPEGLGCTDGYVIMDRNIGATDPIPIGGADDPARGLHYQWGRPVPLRYEGLITSPDRLTFEDFFTDNNPNILYGSHAGVSDDHGWLSDESVIHPHHNHMWGDTSVAFETPQKTLLDPCPPGYFVTPHTFWEGVENFEVGFYPGVGVELNVASNSFWLPSQHIINDDGVMIGGDGVALRTSTINYADSSSHHAPYYLAYTASKTAIISSKNSYGNYAIPVRCISEATDPVVTDLSESQTANCYMVNAPGYYKFKATVRGNGVSQMWPFGGTTMLDISDGLSVDIAPAKVDFYWWQGDFTEVTNTEADLEKLQCIEIMYDGKLNAEGYVMFRIEELHAGNAILAAYDNSGNILWTWHLWLTKDKPADVASGWRSVQDRSLGATQAPKIGDGTLSFVDYAGNEYPSNTTNKEVLWATYGFYYQWGRKDPIMAPPIGSTGSQTPGGDTLDCPPYWVKDYTTGNWEMRTTIPRSNQVTIRASVAAPLNFYMSDYGAGSASAQWHECQASDYKRNVALWGYAVDNYSDVGKDFSKTMYDPCPPGYRTAFHDVWRIVTANNVEYAYGGDDSGNAQYNWNLGEQNYSSFGFVTLKPYFGKVWYPYSGMRLATTGGYERVGTYGYLNSGMPMDMYNTRTFYFTSGWSRQICGNTQNATGASYNAADQATAYGKPVRCMKE